MRSKYIPFLFPFLLLKFPLFNLQKLSLNGTNCWHSNCSLANFKSNSQIRTRRSDRWSNQRTWGTSSHDSAEIDEFRQSPNSAPIAGFRDLSIQPLDVRQQLEEQRRARRYRQWLEANNMEIPSTPSRIPQRVRNFYTSPNGPFQRPRGGWAENWNNDRVEFPEPLRRDPIREMISGRPGGEEAYRQNQRALADLEANRAIRRNFENDPQLTLWNRQLRERQRDPLVSPFMPVPRRATAGSSSVADFGQEEAAGPSHGRRQPHPRDRDRYLDWNEHTEPLERARERLGYLDPPRGKPPKPKGLPRLPGYYEALYKTRNPNEQSLPNYYESLGKFDPRKIKMGIKMQLDKAKQFAESTSESIRNRLTHYGQPPETAIPRREMGLRRAQQATVPSYYGFVGRGPSATSQMEKGGDLPTSSQQRVGPSRPRPTDRSRSPSPNSIFSRRGSQRSNRSRSPTPPRTPRNNPRG